MVTAGRSDGTVWRWLGEWLRCSQGRRSFSVNTCSTRHCMSLARKFLCTVVRRVFVACGCINEVTFVVSSGRFGRWVWCRQPGVARSVCVPCQFSWFLLGRHDPAPASGFLFLRIRAHLFHAVYVFCMVSVQLLCTLDFDLVLLCALDFDVCLVWLCTLDFDVCPIPHVICECRMFICVTSLSA